MGKIRQKTMMITGGAGFIGSNFVRYALEHYQGDIVVVDKLTYAGNPENLTGIQKKYPECVIDLE